MKFLKPSPRFPSMFSLGTIASSNTSSLVSDARQPNLSSFLPWLKPGQYSRSSACPTPTRFASSRSRVGFVRMKELISFLPFFSPVTAVATKISPTPPLVMKILVPFSTQWSPFCSARVCVPWASEPAPGSVSPKAPSTSPRASLVRYFCFCSSVPNS